MAKNIRNNRSIKGIKIGRNKELKLTQLADDTTVFLRTNNDIVQLILEIKRFSKASGLILNTAKTKGLILGNYGRNTRAMHGIDFPKTAIKPLGVCFGKNKQECLQLSMVLGKLPVPGRPTILITVGQGPIALAVGGGGLDIFTLIYPFSSFSLSLGDGSI